MPCSPVSVILAEFPVTVARQVVTETGLCNKAGLLQDLAVLMPRPPPPGNVWLHPGLGATHDYCDWVKELQTHQKASALFQSSNVLPDFSPDWSEFWYCPRCSQRFLTSAILHMGGAVFKMFALSALRMIKHLCERFSPNQRVWETTF